VALEGSYITVDEADAYAAGELDSAVWDALTDGQKAAALRQATAEIDAVAWQGDRCDPDQDRAFPRYAGVLPGDNGRRARFAWDFDEDASEAVVPEAVKEATYHQAVSIAAGGARRARLADRHDGVAGQSAGGVSETYGPGPMRALCRRAHLLLGRYVRRTGRIV